jgi:hypothetical protein
VLLHESDAQAEIAQKYRVQLDAMTKLHDTVVHEVLPWTRLLLPKSNVESAHIVATECTPQRKCIIVRGRDVPEGLERDCCSGGHRHAGTVGAVDDPLEQVLID